MTPILFALVLAAQSPVAAQETPIRLETATGALDGTLLMPGNTSGKIPVALIIAGSGPTDRDGNTTVMPGKNNSLKQLAEALASEGIASVRYDKRGIAASMSAGKSEADLRFSMYVDDAAAWIKQLRKDPRFSTITVIGHSEGSLIGMMATAAADADAYVSLAGPGRSLSVIIREQLERNLPPAMKPDAFRILDELTAGRTVADVPQPLFVLFRPSVQPYLVSQLSINPAAEIARVKVPVLIVQGTTDIQVPAGEAEILKKGNPAAHVEVIDGMNHVLKEVREASQQLASYSDSTLALHPKLAPAVTAHILKRVEVKAVK